MIFLAALCFSPIFPMPVFCAQLLVFTSVCWCFAFDENSGFSFAGYPLFIPNTLCYCYPVGYRVAVGSYGKVGMGCYGRVGMGSYGVGCIVTGHAINVMM